ncbi:hypothetical protein [Spirosoma gilvum]
MSAFEIKRIGSHTCMTIEKLLNWITPLTLGALVGLYEILHGLFYVLYGTPDQKRDYPLEIVLGLPILVVCLVGHWMISRLTHSNTGTIWIIESILVGLVLYGFYRS